MLEVFNPASKSPLKALYLDTFGIDRPMIKLIHCMTARTLTSLRRRHSREALSHQPLASQVEYLLSR
jgi:hypothetical protein